MILTINGLRSHKLFGGNYNQKEYISITRDIVLTLVNDTTIEKVFTGMATGIDILVGLAVIKFNNDFGKRIILECAIPCSNQTKHFNSKELELYNEILKRADIVTELSNKACTPTLLKERNVYMIDNSDQLLSYWDERKMKSGTYSAINYADKLGKVVNIVNPFNLNKRYVY